MASPKPAKRVSIAEREIKAVQAKRNKLQEQADAALDELAVVIQTHMENGTTAMEAATWITSPEQPRGVTRQYIYKLIKERGAKPKAKAPRPKPKVTIRPKR